MSEEKYQWTPEYDEDHSGNEEVPEETEIVEETETVTEETTESGDPLRETEDDGAAPEEEAAEDEISDREAEEALRARIEARRKRYRRQQRRRKSLSILALILIFAVLFTMCGREIVKLKAENYALRKQQAELKAERDRLAEELKTVSDKEYIKDQARKQLRLLDPGEIMFLFDEDEAQEEAEDTETEEKEGDAAD